MGVVWINTGYDSLDAIAEGFLVLMKEDRHSAI